MKARWSVLAFVAGVLVGAAWVALEALRFVLAYLRDPEEVPVAYCNTPVDVR